jgi:hypothetical protein
LFEELEQRILCSADVSPLATPPLPTEQRSLETSGEFVSQAARQQTDAAVEH